MEAKRKEKRRQELTQVRPDKRKLIQNEVNSLRLKKRRLSRNVTTLEVAASQMSEQAETEDWETGLRLIKDSNLNRRNAALAKREIQQIDEQIKAKLKQGSAN